MLQTTLETSMATWTEDRLASVRDELEFFLTDPHRDDPGWYGFMIRMDVDFLKAEIAYLEELKLSTAG